MDWTSQPGFCKVAEEKRRIPKERLICGDAENLSFAYQNFDSACVFRSLHHMENPRLVLGEMILCARKSVFVYDGAGDWRRLVKMALNKLGLYQPLYSFLRGQPDTGYRPASETEGPVKIFYTEDAIPILKDNGLRIVKTIKFIRACSFTLKNN